MQTSLKSGRNGTILVGEDEPEVRRYLEMALRCHGYDVEFGEDGNEVVDFLRNSQRPVAAVLLDIFMPRKDGLQALIEIRQFNRDLPVIVLSSAHSPVQVVQAMKNGATDYLAKPITHEELCASLQRVLNGKWQKTPASPQRAAAAQNDTECLVGVGSSAELLNTVRKVAPTDIPVLIQGETGSGKEVVARYLHVNSRRASKPFLKLNCAALPSELVESELFGYERGAFTGAFQKKVGMFELADGGTLLLDEIGDMDFKLQAKLLQVLQDQTFQHIGGKETVKVDVRVLAATHRNLEEAIVAGTFREDLYYRLNVIALQVPPLRERKDEIILLAELLLLRHNSGDDATPPLTPELRDAMVEYNWPGNVRELENFVRKYIVLREPDAAAHELRQKTLRRSSVTIVMPRNTAVVPKAAPSLERVSRAKEEAERETILAALYAARWNRKRAALELGIEYKALLYKMKKLSIEAGDEASTGRPKEALAIPPASEVDSGVEGSRSFAQTAR